MNKSSSRQQAVILKKDVQLCEVCGCKDHLQVHHKDRNPLNNADTNLIKLCYFCHAREHRGEFIPIGYTDSFKRPKANNIVVSDKKTSVVILNLLQHITKSKRSSIKVDFARKKLRLNDYIDVTNYIIHYLA